MTTSTSISIADELIKLNQLRTDRVISDAEFKQPKPGVFRSSGASSPESVPPPTPAPARTVSNPTDWSAVSLKNKWLFQLLMSFVMIPVGMTLMLFCVAYQKQKNGQIVRIGKGTKAFLIILAALVWALTLARLAANP